MALTPRQLILYTYRVNLYRPSPITTYPDADSAVDNARDMAWDAVPAYSNVPCYFKSTSEVDLPATQGLNKEANIFTLDVFLFDAAQEINGQWLVQIVSPITPGISGGFWYVQDNPRTTPSLGNRRVNQTQIYGKRGPDPRLS